ncbi:MAG: GNAT family N-acetyltransferase [Asgard group archaeon]|nr:GNAT family N-acetyltransferase [Asgard group archaeon]
MTKDEYKIKEFDPFNTSDEIFEGISQLLNSIFREVEKIDPLPTKELRIKGLTQKNPLYDWKHWLIYNNNEIIGYANIVYPKKGTENYDLNKHIAYPTISIHKDHRRKGLGTRLLKVLLEDISNHEEVTTLEAETNRLSGRKFCEKLKGTLAFTGIDSRCLLEDIDWSLMEKWKKAGKALAKTTGIQLLKFNNVPEEILENYCVLWTEVDNQQPFGELDSRDVSTPDIRRQYEEYYTELGYSIFTLLAKEKDGTLSGLTEIRQHESSPFRVTQDLTGVREQFRGRGLGKWLKAEMAFLIREKFPEVRYIQTGNAETNEAMLSINNRMGFKEHRTNAEYKFSVEKLKKVVDKLST